MSARLAREQADFVAALWTPRRADAVARLQPHAEGRGWERGLAAYRSNGLELAHRALAAAYPTVRRLLGEGDFAALARECWRRHPPRCGDVGEWGGDLAAQIARHEELCADVPALPDVARLEWVLHRAAFAHDGEPEPASFALLAGCEPDQVTLVPAHATAVASAHPVAGLVAAQGEAPPPPPRGETALVWRDGLRPRLRVALAGEPVFLAALQAGRSLGAALRAAPALDFEAWLPLAARTGLLLAVRAHAGDHEEEEP
jgi:hypothetical protein